MAARNFAGGAAASTLSGGIASGDTTISVASGSTWPTGSASYVIDRGLAGEEKILATRSGNTLTATRGYDGTTAAAHSSGAAIEHVATATDFQEANDHIQATTGHGATGAVVGTTNTQTLTNKTLTAPAIGGATTFTGTQAGAVLDAASTLGGVSGTSLAADRAAWTSFTPTWTADTTNPTIGNGTLEGKYRLVGKTLDVQIYLLFGSTSTAGSGTWYFALPAGLSAKRTVGLAGVVNSAVIIGQANDLPGVCQPLNGDVTKMMVRSVASSSSNNLVYLGHNLPAAWTTNYTLQIAYRVETV